MQNEIFDEDLGDAPNMILIRGKSLRDLHDKIGDAICELCNAQDEVSEQIEKKEWFERYLRGPFTFL